ncbi:MAG: hypothetical protein NVSMB17_08330 [Candidatus Dormibacteria bacterium]
MLTASRPYRLLCGLLLYVVAILWADVHVGSLSQQYLLGVLTFAVLALALRTSDWEERRLVVLCVVLATGLELFGSLFWGEYRYRFGNVPLYVPAGHGMVCLFALRAARTPLLVRHGRLVSMLVLLVAGTWALAGLSLIPWYLHGRKDTGGALLFPIFAAFILRSRRYRYFVGIFVATTVLELFGTAFGNWTWMVSAPVVRFGAGNPPSVIAGAYCVLDGAVLLLGAALARLQRGRGAPSLPSLDNPLDEGTLGTAVAPAVGKEAPRQLVF